MDLFSTKKKQCMQRPEQSTSPPHPAPGTWMLRTTVTQGHQAKLAVPQLKKSGPSHGGEESLDPGPVAKHLASAKSQFGWNLHIFICRQQIFLIVGLLCFGLVWLTKANTSVRQGGRRASEQAPCTTEARSLEKGKGSPRMQVRVRVRIRAWQEATCEPQNTP